MDKYEYINYLLDQNNISLIDLAEYYSNNKTLIDSFRNVFEEKNEIDSYIVSTIPFVLNTENAETICKKNNLEIIESTIFEQYKVPILTALLYNNRFFVHACNWCSYALYQAEKENKSEHILKINWEELNINNLAVYSQAAATNDFVQIYPASDDIESKLYVYWHEIEKTMHFIFTFDKDYKEKHGSIKIELNGLMDLEGKPISEVLIDKDLNELNEISIKIKADFSNGFEISRVFIKK